MSVMAVRFSVSAHYGSDEIADSRATDMFRRLVVASSYRARGSHVLFFLVAWNEDAGKKCFGSSAALSRRNGIAR